MFKTILTKLGERVANSWGLKVAYIAMAIIVVILMGLLAWLLPALLVWSINELLEQAQIAYQIAWNGWTWLAGLSFIALVKG